MKLNEKTYASNSLTINFEYEFSGNGNAKTLFCFRFKNRELQIMRRLEHCNIVKLMYFFYTSGEKKDEIYLNLVLEFIPETVCLVLTKDKSLLCFDSVR